MEIVNGVGNRIQIRLKEKLGRSYEKKGID